MATMLPATVAVEASILLRRRLCDPVFVFTPFKSSTDSNYSKLKFIVSSSINEACNNSVLLLGPRGSGKISVLELVLEDLKAEFLNMITVVRLNGMLHGDDNCGLKEIARQLCLDHGLLFSKMASSDDNSQFLIDMLRECGLAHRTIIFVLDEFDLFAQGKQRLLYGLLDAMQSLTSQAVVIGVSCRLITSFVPEMFCSLDLTFYKSVAVDREDADQLLEKRVRSRFSHRKLLFAPPSDEDLRRLVGCILYLPTDSSFPEKFAAEFNSRICNILCDKSFKDILGALSNVDNSISNTLRFIFRAVSFMDMESGFLSLENFKNAVSCLHRQPKLENIQNASILELYLLVCMHRLETKEQNSYNFNSIMKEYRSIHDAYRTSDYRVQNVCLRAFERLLQRELVGFVDNKRGCLSIEFHPVKLLVSPHELHQALKSCRSCPILLQKLLDHEAYK